MRKAGEKTVGKRQAAKLLIVNSSRMSAANPRVARQLGNGEIRRVFRQELQP